MVAPMCRALQNMWISWNGIYTFGPSSSRRFARICRSHICVCALYNAFILTLGRWSCDCRMFAATVSRVTSCRLMGIRGCNVGASRWCGGDHQSLSLSLYGRYSWSSASFWTLVGEFVFSAEHYVHETRISKGFKVFHAKLCEYLWRSCGKT